jgi:hypothetical protein
MMGDWALVMRRWYHIGPVANAQCCESLYNLCTGMVKRRHPLGNEDPFCSICLGDALKPGSG